MLRLLLLTALLAPQAGSPNDRPPAPPDRPGVPADHRTADRCTLRIVRDYDVGYAYYAEPQLSPTCPDGSVLRVRKSSTLSLKSAGAPYQPIYPLTGAWEVSGAGTTIPVGQRWTLNSWQWQWYSEPAAAWKAARVLP